MARSGTNKEINSDSQVNSRLKTRQIHKQRVEKHAEDEVNDSHSSFDDLEIDSDDDANDGSEGGAGEASQGLTMEVQEKLNRARTIVRSDEQHVRIQNQ